jgi:hypothetical protein
MSKPLAARIALGLVLVFFGATSAQPITNIQTALDKPINLVIAEPIPIGDVFERLSAASGVRFFIDPDTYDLLPYGDQTRITIKLRNVTLRSALTPVLAPQALSWNIGPDSARIVPSEPLYRMCRRASYEELITLGKLLTDTDHAPRNQILPPADPARPDYLAQLRKITGNENLKIAFPEKTDEAAVFAKAQRMLPATAEQWLNMVCQAQGWTWYLWGDTIMVVDQKQQIERQLQRLVSVNYKDADLVPCMLDLARKARVKLTMDAGVMAMVPPEKLKSFNLTMTDASVAQALEVISGATGLKFVPTAEGVTVEASDALKNLHAASQPARPRIFVKMPMTTPGGTAIEVYLGPDELPADVMEAIEAQKAKLVDQLRAQYPTKPQATSGPATRPSAEPTYETQVH